jgi:hypothetical protein
MPQDATCPTCAHAFPVTEARHAFAVACPKCDAHMTVEFRKPAVAPEPGQPHYDLFVQAGAPAGADPLGAPPAKRRRADDDKPKGRSNAVVLVSGGLGLLFVMLGLGATGWFLFTQIDTTPATANRNTPNVRPGPNRLPNVPQQPPRFEPPPFEPPKIDPPKIDPPRPNLVLPAPPDPVAILPAPVTKETTYKLPEPARALRAGGGGRYLVMHFPQARRFGIFDTNEARITRFVPVADGEPAFAAGMRKLVVFAPSSKVLTRYDLATGAREASRRLDVPDGAVEAFCMGHSSAGPLLIGVKDKGAGLYDIDTFKELDLPTDGLQFAGGKQRLEGGYYWAGGLGRVFGHTGNYGQPNGVKTVVLGSEKVERHGQHEGTWFVVPGPDDRYVFAGGHGVLTERVTAVNDAAFSMGPGKGFASHLYMPAAHGPFYLLASTIEGFGRDGTPPVGTIQLYMHGSKEPFAKFEKTAVAKYGWDGLKGFGIEHSVHLIPKAKLLVVVPEARDVLHLYPADLDKLLDADGRNYLYVSSVPNTQFEKGRTLAFAIEARAKNGPARFRLESGPPGLTVSATGLLRWAVPADYPDARAEAILVLTDAKGNEQFHTIALAAK